MAIPPNAFAFAQPMDPSDTVDFQVTLSQGSGATDFLTAGESVLSYTLTLTAEAVAAGLVIKTTGGYSTILTGNVIRFWLAVDIAHQADSGFSVSGLALAIELTVQTNASPARVKQRTLSVTVAQQ